MAVQNHGCLHQLVHQARAGYCKGGSFADHQFPAWLPAIYSLTTACRCQARGICSSELLNTPPAVTGILPPVPMPYQRQAGGGGGGTDALQGCKLLKCTLKDLSALQTPLAFTRGLWSAFTAGLQGYCKPSAAACNALTVTV